MKKLRILKPIPGFKEGETIELVEITDTTVITAGVYSYEVGKLFSDGFVGVVERSLRYVKEYHGNKVGEVVDLVRGKDALTNLMRVTTAERHVSDGFAEWVEEEKRCKTMIPVPYDLMSKPHPFTCKVCGQTWAIYSDSPVCKGKKEESKYVSPYEVKPCVAHQGYFVEGWFDTQSEAEVTKKWLDAYTEIKEWAGERNGGWKPDWKYEGQKKYFCRVSDLPARIGHYAELVITIDLSTTHAIPMVFYFRKKEDAEESARIHEKQYKIFAGITDENDDNVNMTYEWVKGRDTSKWL